MIISTGRRYIFAHAPKTGGTAMALALEGRAMKDDVLIGDTPKAVKRRKRLEGLAARGRLWKHSTLADIEGVISRDQMANMFVFTLTRNPWDRLVSYYHWLQVQTFDHPAVKIAQDQGFAAFLRDPLILPAFTKQPIAAMTMDGAGVNHANLVARIEHVDTDLAPLWDHLGFGLTLERVNASKRDRDYRRYYSEADADLVADACAADIAQAGYAFG